MEAVPISTKDGKIFAVELSGGTLAEQLPAIERKRVVFEHHQLLAVLKVSYRDALYLLNMDTKLPAFVRLMISEDFPNLHDGMSNALLRDLMKFAPLWLGNLGAGNSNVQALQDRMFEAAVLDRQFILANIDKQIFQSVLVQGGRFCQIITPMPTNARTWTYGIRPINFEKLELLVS
ncbi:hypothetical protein GKQ23_13100 [Erwinia sp. E602]|uniref:hypothetical protein n=1 Tax=Erwinia sp. E602 TaxID=2675378 RepID=UPI001BAE226B|nr:hypothetical protein [Erwinia sp. E602]QUG75871.1 hypothetical protein GKQ23_13100 [Erwinia sp. E602]